MIEWVTSNATVLIGAIGVLAFLVGVITQVTKNIGILAKIPTDLESYVVSLILTVCAYFALISYQGIAFVWYCLVCAIIMSFVVALVAQQGWSSISSLWKRFVTDKPTTETLANTDTDEETDE